MLNGKLDWGSPQNVIERHWPNLDRAVPTAGRARRHAAQHGNRAAAVFIQCHRRSWHGAALQPSVNNTPVHCDHHGRAETEDWAGHLDRWHDVLTANSRTAKVSAQQVGSYYLIIHTSAWIFCNCCNSQMVKLHESKIHCTCCVWGGPSSIW